MSSVKVPSSYRPSEKEEFMNAKMREYFRQKLLDWREELLRESSETIQHLQSESLAEPDIADRASLETDRPLGELVGRVCRPTRWKGRRVRALHPWSKDDRALLQTISRGEFAVIP